MLRARAAVLLALFLSTRVFAQDLTPPPPPPLDPVVEQPAQPEPQPPAQVLQPAAINNPRIEQTTEQPTAPAPQELSFSQRCFSRPTGWYGGYGHGYYWRPATIITSGPGPVGAANGSTATTTPSSTHGAKPVGSSGSSSGGGGGKDGALLLVAVVVVAAVLPIIFYAMDDAATPDVEGRFMCPSFELDVKGGFESDGVSGPSVPFSVRMQMTQAWLGVVAQLDLAPWSEPRRMINGEIAALVRFTPHEHVELGLTIGYRSLVLRNEWRPGLAIAIPHEYVLSRDGASKFGIELKPAVFIWSQGADVSLDVGVRIPFGPIVDLSLGGRVFTIDALQHLGGGLLGGLGLKL